MSEKTIGKCMFCGKDVVDSDIVSRTVKITKKVKVQTEKGESEQDMPFDDVLAPLVAVLKDGRLACYEHPGVLELSRGAPIPPPRRRGADEEDTEV